MESARKCDSLAKADARVEGEARVFLASRGIGEGVWGRWGHGRCWLSLELQRGPCKGLRRETADEGQAVFLDFVI